MWLLDWKTADKGIFPEAALQLAAYAHAEFYIDAEGEERPLPKIDAAGGVWLRSDGYDLIPCDVSEQVFQSFLYAQQMAHFVKAPREAVIGEALRPPEVAA
jgi:hypothetical protein